MVDLDEYIARLEARPWWQKTWDYLRYRLPYILRHLPRDARNSVSRFFQRGRKGWSRQDVWSLDHHLSLIIPQMLHELVRQTKGFSTPSSFCDETGKDDNEGWIAWLERIASAFEDYESIMHGDEATNPFDKARYDRALATMRELFDHYADLWS